MAVRIAALREIHDLAGLHINQGYIGIVPAAVRTVLGENAAAVRAPLELLVSV